MKPERRNSFINRSFRRSFRRKKDEEDEKSPEEVKADQDKALAELQKAVGDVSGPDLHESNLRRFLKAKDYDVKEAEKLFRLSINCQRFLMLKTFSEDLDVPDVVKEFNFCGFLGFDKEGSAVRLVNLGLADLRGFIHSISTLQLMKLLLHYMWQDIMRLQEENKRSGRTAEQFLYIVNMQSLSTSQLTHKPVLDTALLAVKLFQDFFYDISKEVIIINAPSYFPTLYKLMKPVIQDSLHKKIKVYGYDKWQEVLSEKVGGDVLPVHFGGARVDSNGDARCSEFIAYGGEIPQLYYEDGQHILDPNDPEVKTVVVGAGSFVNVPLPIKHVGNLITFHVMSKDNDIAVGLFYEPPTNGCETPLTKKKSDSKDAMSRLEPLIPIVRCQCHIRPIVGYTSAWKKGTHILHLDNTYSWMSPKEVYYKLQMQEDGSQSARSAS